MIQKGKLKVDDIIEKREEWVAVSLSAFQENFVTFIVCRLYGSKFYYLLQTSLTLIVDYQLRGRAWRKFNLISRQDV